MIGTFPSFSLDKTIGLSIGFLIGVIPVAEYNVPVLMTLMSVVCGIKHVDRQAVKAAFPVILYCATMIGFMIYHPGGWEYDDKLVKVMATVAIAAIPMVAMFRTYVGRLERVEVSILLGIITICAVFAYQYFIEGGCRVSAFSVGPLGPPITLLPLSMYLITKRSFENRFGVLDGLVICLLFLSLGAFLGARMHFYSMTVLCVILVVVLTLQYKLRFAATITLFAVLGIYGGYTVDKCGQFARMGNHLKIFEILFSNHSKPMKNQALTGVIEIASNSRKSLHTTTDATQSWSELAKSNLVYSQKTDVSDTERTTHDNTRLKLLKAEQTDYSAGQRVQIWKEILIYLSTNAETKNLLFGSGRIKEQRLSSNVSKHPHAHNQFLSWAISTGFLGVTIAIMMFASLISRLFSDFSVFIFMSACFLCFITDSPLWIRDTTSQFLIMLLFVLTFIKKPSNH